VTTLDPKDVEPPDDSGSDTFARFAYQAHAMFPLCLYAATGNEIQNIYAEHIEDVAVEFNDRWRFLQIKTRDPGLGPWKFSDVTSKGGAIHSLWRSYTAVGNGTAATYELHLEGHLGSGDAINHLRSVSGRSEETLITRVRNAVKGGDGEVRAFCTRLDVKFLPVRASIASSNIRLLGDHAPSLPFGELRNLYERVIAALQSAMTAGRLEERWYAEIMGKRSSANAELLASKCISRTRATELLDRVSGGPRPLLRRIIETSPEPSVLEQKLIAGGATQALIGDAKELRANASIRRMEYLASTSDGDQYLEDLRQRLRVAANGLVAEHSPAPKVAAVVWNRLRTELTASAVVTDHQRIFGQDPHLLLGEVCELSDECVTDWGRDDA
jgi:hypothetical protein